MASTSIQYLQHNQLDITKWNQCIDEAPNGLVYGYSFYLDQMARHWDALVWRDYEAVMPLTWNKKYGVYYLYQPAFTASLGVFGRIVTEDMVKDFVDAIPNRFRLIEISLNEGNIVSPSFGNAVLRSNYVLDLRKDYNTLFDNYRENIRRNIKKCQQLDCYCERNIPVEDVIYLSSLQMRSVSNLTTNDYENFRKLYKHLQPKGQAVSYGVFTPGKQLVASCIYFFSHQRAYYILVGNHPNGKTIGASHFLIDRFIYDWADKDLWLDFEGSDIRNLAFFYSSFGATVETYPAIRINRLPKWMKWLKK